MTDLNTNHWLSAHLYYNEPWERLLVRAINPFIQTTLQTGIANQFFFIRYWDRGPHIRLRIAGEKDVIQKVLKPHLVEHFESYFDSRPSHRTEPNYPQNFPDIYKWLPNNSVQMISYRPEVNRYGGPYGIRITEDQFYWSSLTIFRHYQNQLDQWHYEDAMGMAIRMHLCLAKAAGFNERKTAQFFDYIFRLWMPHTLKLFNDRLTGEEYQRLHEKTITAYHTSFEQQKPFLVPLISTMWDSLESEFAFEEPYFNEWMLACRNQVRMLRNTLVDGNLILEYTSKEIPAADPLFPILADWVHMTNNRLGILNKDEGHLGYLMMQAMRLVMQPEKELGA